MGSYILQISTSLSEFHEWVREIVRSACEEALHDENFEPDPSDNIEGNVTRAMLMLQHSKASKRM